MPGKVVKAVSSMVQAAKHITTDGWSNILTGVGMAGMDKAQAAYLTYATMTELEAETLYSADDVAATIVDTLPDEACRQWLTVTSDVDGLGADLDKAMDAIKAPSALNRAWKWGRLYGGAAALINVDDSKDLGLPLDLNQVRELKSFIVLTRWELQAGTIDTDIFSTRYGMPLTYRLSPKAGNTTDVGQEIHHSRLIPFLGVELPMRQQQQNQYWGDSVLNRPRAAIRNYQTSNDAVATILQEFNQGVFKIKGLADMLLNGEDDAVLKRLTIVALAKSVARAVVIDADSEEFNNIGAAVTGLPDTLKTVSMRLVTASRMPHTKLLGESPSGLGATGESEEKTWNDYVSNQQESLLRPAVQRILDILIASKNGPTKGKPVENLHFEFVALKQPSQKEIIADRKAQAEIDNIYITNNVVDPSEIRKSRFGSGKYSHETVVELEMERKDPETENPDENAPPVKESKDDPNA